MLKSSKEKRLLVAESGVETRGSNSHCLDEVRYRRVVISFLPKDNHRLFKGKLDVVVANSGQVEPVSFEQVTEAHFDKIFDLNARATLFTAQKAVPLMSDGGSIILVGSTAGYMGFPGYTTYSATKAALRSFARTWTAEFKDRGIRVNNLSPGPIDTPIIDSEAETKEGADAIRASLPTPWGKRRGFSRERGG